MDALLRFLRLRDLPVGDCHGGSASRLWFHVVGLITNDYGVLVSRCWTSLS